MPSITLGELRARVYGYLEDNSEFYPPEELNSAINESVRTLNLFTGFLQSSAPQMLTIAGRVFYDVPPDLILLMRVKIRGRYLDPAGLTSISNATPDWMRRTTLNTGGPVVNWVPIGLRRFALTPADSVGGAAMILTGVTEPTPLVEDDQIMQFPNDYDTIIIELSKHVLQLDEGGAIFSQASTGYQDFLRDAKSLNMFKAMKMPSYVVDQQLKK